MQLLQETELMRAVRLNQDSKVLGHKAKAISKKMLKHSIELRKIAEAGDSSLWVDHYE